MPSLRPFISDGTYKKASPSGASSARNNTDVSAPEVRLYIEGVQVPFIAMSIGQAYGRKPQADIQIPPESGLLDIIRGYEPKVHIFYKDENYGGFRLLFWGRITSSNYNKSRQGAGYSTISFRCEHKNSLLDQVILDFSGWANSNSPSLLDANSAQATTQINSFNSQIFVVNALKGLTGLATNETAISRKHPNIQNAETDKLDPALEKHQKRLLGLASLPVTIWNQMKKNCFLNPVFNISLESMYFPLVEEALGFFKRLSGHTLIEQKVQAASKPYCHKVDGKEVSIMTPPSMTLPIASAEQQRLAVEVIHSQVGFSGELTSYEDLLRNVFNSIQYEILTFASPAEIHVDPEIYAEDGEGVEKVAVETVIKPQLPTYYSPICNVLLPRMYSEISINQEEGTIPSRVTATYDALSPTSAGTNRTTLNYRGPHSVREAVAYNAFLQSGDPIQSLNIASTKSYSYSIPGRYEQGRGIKPDATAFPWWLGVFSNNKSQGSVIGDESVPSKGTEEYDALMALTVEWRNRNGILVRESDGFINVAESAKKWKLNPYDLTNDSLKSHERLFYSTVDYEYSKRFLGSRSGTISAAFNPYIIPGYPMDVIDDSPNHPSFHGLCTSVTHTITADSISTSISMAAATTYAELSNYYTAPATPFLQTALDLVNVDIDRELYDSTPIGDASPFSNVRSTLLQNPKAKETADTFYKQVLGVGAAAPEDLMHFASGRAMPVDRIGGVFKSRVVAQEGSYPDDRGHNLVDSQGRHLVDYYSTVGNLRLVSRPIESMNSIATKFDYAFIDLDRTLYNGTYVNYRNPILASNFFLEPGASMFLDYMETEEFIRAAKGRLDPIQVNNVRNN